MDVRFGYLLLRRIHVDPRRSFGSGLTKWRISGQNDLVLSHSLYRMFSTASEKKVIGNSPK